MESRFFYNVDDKSEPFHNEENVSDDISEALMRGVIRDLRASIKNPQDYNSPNRSERPHRGSGRCHGNSKPLFHDGPVA